MLAAWILPACRATGSQAETAATDELQGVLVELYDAFGFESGQEPDWAAQRRLALEGAAFVPSLRPGRVPVATGIEPFFADFRAFVQSEPWASTGFKERIVGVQIERFGALAHAFVAFEGYVPGEDEATTRGLDSLQLVHDGSGWKVTAFATQFERDDLALPERFVDR